MFGSFAFIACKMQIEWNDRARRICEFMLIERKSEKCKLYHRWVDDETRGLNFARRGDFIQTHNRGD